VVLTAVMMTALLGMVALAVDLGNLYVARTELQKAADAASLAGAGALFSKTGVDISGAMGNAVQFAGMNRAAGDNVLLGAGDVQVGRIESPLTWGSPFQLAYDATANSVQVMAARRVSEGRGIDLFFAPLFGINQASVGATATATRVPVSSAQIIPIALRTPNFGPVDPNITEHNPGKDGPSYPANGVAFQLGEEVVVFIFGKGVRPPIHLVLDLPDYSGIAETQKLLSGESYPAMVSIGDQMPAWNTGDGDGNFGVKLVDRMEDDSVLNNTVVLPIVDTLPDSRDDNGNLTGDIVIVDFVGVELLRVDTVSVKDPDSPGQGRNYFVDRVVGEVVPVTISNGQGSNTPGGYAENSVVMLQLVK
jgi:hypothetical protein